VPQRGSDLRLLYPVFVEKPRVLEVKLSFNGDAVDCQRRILSVNDRHFEACHVIFVVFLVGEGVLPSLELLSIHLFLVVLFALHVGRHETSLGQKLPERLSLHLFEKVGVLHHVGCVDDARANFVLHHDQMLICLFEQLLEPFALLVSDHETHIA